ncbi:DUF6318 family protein [Timonella sp. A28]|uniref:DUF6318 family protein n=1 Tax=Timonella sp. A28 TaxID=3442640 RepID=UPI003EBDF648
MSLYKRFSVLCCGVVVCVVALGLSGCSTEPESALSSPTVTPSSPTSESSDSTSPPATQLELPKPTAGMANNDAQGATEAADYFGKMITYIMATQQTDLLDTFAVDGCIQCETSREILADLKEKQHKYKNFVVGFELENKPQKAANNHWFAEAKITVQDHEILDRNSVVVSKESGSTDSGKLMLMYEDSQWKLVGFVYSK